MFLTSLTLRDFRGGQLKNHPVCHINVNLLLPSSFIQYLRVKSEIWDLGTKLGPFGDHFWTLVPIGTKSQIWDLIGSTECRQLSTSAPENKHRYFVYEY